MPYKQFDIDDISVQMVMVMKLNRLRRNDLPGLTYAQLEEYLMKKLWNERAPSSLNDATNQIFKITADDIVNYSSEVTVKEGIFSKIEDFKDIIGG